MQITKELVEYVAELSRIKLDDAAAEKMQDRLAIARGVSSIEELLEAPVADLSPEAAACGVTPGMKGREALMLMEKK
jgi:uncharacterized protein YunC (DUF1805 family)